MALVVKAMRLQGMNQRPFLLGHLCCNAWAEQGGTQLPGVTSYAVTAIAMAPTICCVVLVLANRSLEEGVAVRINHPPIARARVLQAAHLQGWPQARASALGKAKLPLGP